MLQFLKDIRKDYLIYFWIYIVYKFINKVKIIRIHYEKSVLFFTRIYQWTIEQYLPHITHIIKSFKSKYFNVWKILFIHNISEIYIYIFIHLTKAITFLICKKILFFDRIRKTFVITRLFSRSYIISFDVKHFRFVEESQLNLYILSHSYQAKIYFPELARNPSALVFVHFQANLYIL